MPIITSVNHTGITVVDLERSVSFWVNVMGCKVIERANPTGPKAGAVTGLNVDTDLQIVRLEAPGGYMIELLQYTLPEKREHYKPRPCDVGNIHLAFTVDNLEETKKAMLDAGCVCYGEVHEFGCRLVYLHDFDGVTLELLEMPPKV
ncbi:hypothetical protein D9758_007262 [Tetrapyrgos nigripes]|uniref:VOC domain-containing protein n=1 Tax=Tetrapyrgos nigripes TaxID=182062 RepID=A0A8H5D0X7_9AGAR|nr:hypothetical protein D9758_007262 [Tetrapyrgos nigripes]